jgi:secreted Zn-dependent insulinase-like peptidase
LLSSIDYLEPLDTLQSWVTEKFSAIVNKDVEVPRFNKTSPFPPQFLGKKLEVVPVKDIR